MAKTNDCFQYFDGLSLRKCISTVCAMKNGFAAIEKTASLHIAYHVEDSVQLLGLAGESNMNYDFYLLRWIFL